MSRANKYGAGQPDAPVYEYTDIDGETLTISPNGRGTALLEATGMLVIPPAEFPAIMRALVDSSGIPLDDVRTHYYRKYHAPPTVSRQDRRAQARITKKTNPTQAPTHPAGASFFKETQQ